MSGNENVNIVLYSGHKMSECNINVTQNNILYTKCNPI